MKISKKCIEASLSFLITCESCSTDCITSGNKECIALCRDCAAICALCARFEARGSRFSQDLHALCTKIREICSKECAKHASHHASCHACAEACKKCAIICEEYATTKI